MTKFWLEIPLSCVPVPEQVASAAADIFDIPIHDVIALWRNMDEEWKRVSAQTQVVCVLTFTGLGMFPVDLDVLFLQESFPHIGIVEAMQGLADKLMDNRKGQQMS